MKTIATLLALVFIGCAAGASAKPALRVASRGPLVVAGTGFRPVERVVVTEMTGYGPRRHTAVAAEGRFRVTLSSAKGCGAAYAVRAVGNAGSRASLVFRDAPVCVPPP